MVSGNNMLTRTSYGMYTPVKCCGRFSSKACVLLNCSLVGGVWCWHLPDVPTVSTADEVQFQVTFNSNGQWNTPTEVPNRDVVRHGTASLCGGSVRRKIELGQLRQLLLQLDLGSLRNSYSYFMFDNPILCLGLCNIGPVERAVNLGLQCRASSDLNSRISSMLSGESHSEPLDPCFSASC